MCSFFKISLDICGGSLRSWIVTYSTFDKEKKMETCYSSGGSPPPHTHTKMPIHIDFSNTMFACLTEGTFKFTHILLLIMLLEFNIIFWWHLKYICFADDTYNAYLDDDLKTPWMSVTELPKSKARQALYEFWMLVCIRNICGYFEVVFSFRGYLLVPVLVGTCMYL